MAIDVWPFASVTAPSSGIYGPLTVPNTATLLTPLDTSLGWLSSVNFSNKSGTIGVTVTLTHGNGTDFIRKNIGVAPGVDYQESWVPPLRITGLKWSCNTASAVTGQVQVY